MGVTQIKRSSLSDANSQRTANIFSETFFFLLQQVRDRFKSRYANQIKRYDSLQLKAQKDCPTLLRRVKFVEKKMVNFISNDMKRTAVEIAALYKSRWQIELFFKWIKQNLKIKRFLGHSENAVKIQVITTLIANLLLRFAQIYTHCKLSLQQMARRISLNLTNRQTLLELLIDPPEKIGKNLQQNQGGTKF